MLIPHIMIELYSSRVELSLKVTKNAPSRAESINIKMMYYLKICELKISIEWWFKVCSKEHFFMIFSYNFFKVVYKRNIIMLYVLLCGIGNFYFEKWKLCGVVELCRVGSSVILNWAKSNQVGLKMFWSPLSTMKQPYTCW